MEGGRPRGIMGTEHIKLGKWLKILKIKYVAYRHYSRHADH